MKRVAWVLWIVLSWTASASTGVGSGDSIERYLKGTRHVLGEVAQGISGVFDTSHLCTCPKPDTEFTCQYLRSLNADQRRYCQGFLKNTAPQIAELATGFSPVPFRLTEKPIMVKDPDGTYRPVVAMTPIGPGGDVLWNYQRVNQLWPVGLLGVMAHEFGHKVEFGGLGKFIEDSMQFPPFNFPDGGRSLLDAAGAAIAQLARDTGRIPVYVGTEDRFSCEIEDSLAGTGPYFSGESPRMFWGRDTNQYDVGVGIYPKDLQCNYKEPGGESYLSFRVRILERVGCEIATAPVGKRSTEFSLWRVFEKPTRVKPAELLSQLKVEGKNPLCGDSVPMELPVSLRDRELAFSVKYLGTRAGK